MHNVRAPSMLQLLQCLVAAAVQLLPKEDRTL